MECWKEKWNGRIEGISVNTSTDWSEKQRRQQQKESKGLFTGSPIRSVQNSRVEVDKDDNILTKERDIQERWKEHFEDVLNREHPTRLARIENGRANGEIRRGDKIGAKKQQGARKWQHHRLKHVKADIKTSTKWLKKLFDTIWAEEETPEEWSRVMLTTVVPKKGDL